MPTRTSSGQSQSAVTATAVREALASATATLKGKPTAGFLFVSAKHELGEALKAARALASGCEFIGCQTAGEFTEKGRTTGGVAVLLTTLDPDTFSIEAATGVREDPLGVAKKVTST